MYGPGHDEATPGAMMHGPVKPPGQRERTTPAAPLHAVVAPGAQARATPIQLIVVTVGVPPLAPHDHSRDLRGGDRGCCCR